ncbi:MAG: hypothetical protein RL726_519 [Actinomycetota bacterium]
MVMFQMLQFAQACQTERVSIPHLVRHESRDGRMPDDESFPLPRRGLQAQQMTNENAVRSRVCHQQDSSMIRIESPHGQCSGNRCRTSLGHERTGTRMDATDELAHRLSADETLPTMMRHARALFGVRGIRLFAGRSVPQRITNLLQPMLSDGFEIFDTTIRQQRSGGLLGTNERRHPNLVEHFFEQRGGHRSRLAMSSLREGRIVDVQTVADPFGFTVTHEYQFHGETVLVDPL